MEMLATRMPIQETHRKPPLRARGNRQAFRFPCVSSKCRRWEMKTISWRPCHRTRTSSFSSRRFERKREEDLPWGWVAIAGVLRLLLLGSRLGGPHSFNGPHVTLDSTFELPGDPSTICRFRKQEELKYFRKWRTLSFRTRRTKQTKRKTIQCLLKTPFRSWIPAAVHESQPRNFGTFYSVQTAFLGCFHDIANLGSIIQFLLYFAESPVANLCRPTFTTCFMMMPITVPRIWRKKWKNLTSKRDQGLRMPR